MMQFVATAPNLFEDLVEAELVSLGISDITRTAGAVRFQASLQEGYKAALWLRSASRVMLEVGRFACDSADELYEGAKELPWEDHILGGFYCGMSSRGKLPFSMEFGVLRIKDAVADRMREQEGSRPMVDKAMGLRIQGHWDRGWVSIYIDLSGDPLWKRGYRRYFGSAPIHENLAAAMLMRAGWTDKLASYKGPRHELGLLDPLCGSGTILIEAAMMAANLAPGLGRKDWGFYRWKGFDEDLWEQTIQEARDAADFSAMPQIIGADRDGEMIRHARENAERAGVDAYIQIEERELQDSDTIANLLPSHGLLITNPPYGVRMESEVYETYQCLGGVYALLPKDWQLAMITSEDDLSFATGLRSYKQYRMKNGDLDCKLYLFKDQKVFAQADFSKQGEQFRNRLKKNLNNLKKWAEKENIYSYRVYDADLPDFNMAIDWYEGRWVHVAEYAPKVDIASSKRTRRILQAKGIIRELMNPEEIVIKERKQSKGGSQYGVIDRKGEQLLARENGYKYWLNLNDYLDTGIFLDHRPMRTRIQAEAEDKRFLNLFCYTATATLAAVAGGARSSISIDTSNSYLSWARANFDLNDIDESRHELIRDDAMDWLRANRESFDLIFIDPPTFSNNKTKGLKFDIAEDHGTLIHRALYHLAPDGVIYFSTNYKGFEMNYINPRVEIVEITKETIGPDFARKRGGGPIHRCWMIRRKDGVGAHYDKDKVLTPEQLEEKRSYEERLAEKRSQRPPRREFRRDDRRSERRDDRRPRRDFRDRDERPRFDRRDDRRPRREFRDRDERPRFDRRDDRRPRREFRDRDERPKKRVHVVRLKPKQED